MLERIKKLIDINFQQCEYDDNFFEQLDDQLHCIADEINKIKKILNDIDEKGFIDGLNKNDELIDVGFEMSEYGVPEDLIKEYTIFKYHNRLDLLNYQYYLYTQVKNRFKINFEKI